jgi:hypothetical protein
MIFNKKTTYAVMFIIMVLLSALAVAVSLPEGPTQITQVLSQKRLPYPANTKEAEAGNITQITLYGKTATQSWQGYVGNVTGLVVLDDARNYTLYNWTITNPRGEIYATYLSSVDWTTGNVNCWNWTVPSTNYVGLGVLEGWDTGKASYSWGSTVPGRMGCSDIDIDCVNETFTYPGSHNPFFVGGKGISQDTCPAVSLKNNNDQGVFQEIMLYNNKTSGGANGDGVIYTSILRDNVVGYDGNQWDFEMLVGQNGHNGSTTTTTYYFYVELS